VTRRRLLLVLAVAALAALAVAASVVLLAGEDDDGSDAAPPAETGAAEDAAGGLERCAALADDSARSCYAEELKALVDEAVEPGAALEEIANCHGLMSRPQDAAAVCHQTGTRYQRYNCIHGFGDALMRLVREDLTQALRLCAALGVEAPGCSQGAFHDHWFAVSGDARDGRPDLRELCGGQPQKFVRPCWYRAFLDQRPGGTGLECDRWLGKVLSVLTNGEFEQFGCPAAASERSRRACVQGARASDEALETFS